MPGVRGSLPECWGCGREDQLHGSRGLCCRCYGRWRSHHFAGPGPGPEFTSQLTRARDQAAVLGGGAQQAAWRLGVSTRTIQRYKRALREAR